MNHGNDLFDPASLIVAHDEAHAFEAVVPPIVQTSLFTFSSYDEMVSTYRGEKVRPVYTRGLNPTVRLFEEMLAKLEGAEDALVLQAACRRSHPPCFPSCRPVTGSSRYATFIPMLSACSAPS